MRGTEMPWAKSNPYADTCESGGKLQDRPTYLIFGLSGRKRLRENAHIFGSMGKMQLRHGAFGNTDGIPPLGNSIFVRLFTCCFIKSCTFVRLIWKGGQIRGIPNHNISPATSYLDTYLQTTKKDNYNG